MIVSFVRVNPALNHSPEAPIWTQMVGFYLLSSLRISPVDLNPLHDGWTVISQACKVQNASTTSYSTYIANTQT